MTPWGLQMRNSRSGQLGTCRGRAALGEGAGLRLPIVSHQSAEVPTTQAIFKTWKRKGQGLYPVTEDKDERRAAAGATEHGARLSRSPTTGRPRTVCSCIMSCAGSVSGPPSQPSVAVTPALTACGRGDVCAPGLSRKCRQPSTLPRPPHSLVSRRPAAPHPGTVRMLFLTPQHRSSRRPPLCEQVGCGPSPEGPRGL